MATDYEPQDIKDGFQNATSLNANFAAIRQALEDSLSRKGGTPNQLESEIDVNSQRLLNLPDPTSPGEPVTLGYLMSLPSTVTPPVGVDNPMPMDLDMDSLYKVVNAVNPTQPQDYVTLDYFDNNQAGGAGGGPIDADTLDGYDSGAPSDITGPAVVTRDVNGDIWARRVNLSAVSQTPTPSRVAVEIGSSGEIVWQTFAQFRTHLGANFIPQINLPAFSMTLPVAGIHTVTTGLTAQPSIVQAYAICTTADGPYVAGDTVALNPNKSDEDEGTGPNQSGLSLLVKATTIDVRVENTIALSTISATTLNLTPANWDIQLRLLGQI